MMNSPRKELSPMPFAGANNRHSQFKFTNRNDQMPYSEAIPSYLRICENEGKSYFVLDSMKRIRYLLRN
jgi:hypothetical protein